MRTLAVLTILAACGDDGGGVSTQSDGAVDTVGSGECIPSADTCTGSTICIEGSCEPIIPRTYTFSAIKVHATPTMVGGQMWDVDATPPDIYVRVYSLSMELAVTTTMPDTFD